MEQTRALSSTELKLIKSLVTQVRYLPSPISPEPSSAQVDNSPPSKESSKKNRLPYPSRVEHEKKGENDKALPALQSTRNDLELANVPLCVPIGIARECPWYPVNNDVPPTSAIVDEFESLLGDIIKQKEELKGISDPVARRRACFARLDNFKTFSNPLFEKEDDFPSRNDESILKEETFKSYLNPLFEDDEEIISNEASSKISPKFVKDNVEINHEVFKSDSKFFGNHDDKEGGKMLLDSLLEDENFFEMNDKNDESFESKTKEDFETKVEPEKKKELQVFHPDIEILDQYFRLPLMYVE
ncbi:hypothetical protein Tco_1185841 [Tanacetum coccineum]